MLPLEFPRFILPRIAAPLLAGLALAASHGPSRAEEARGVYILPGHDGYALVECLTQKKGCGKAVADSWCEAHGHGPAQAYGRADDITGSVGAASASLDADSAIVTCGE
jgi:hypothetical protein